ncbi:putative pentatricopeptide repeat-containing protein At5g59200, chloroplastic isoform X3 [Elaeis guineensis]|uniref:putative pentatricopeptide repeat-containing protein At5g59200, chloroplastic isoform X3 n=1 Tax=Elaeis guineensis var. tenera TaxID=51953 RepID=UPI003C6D6830
MSRSNLHHLLSKCGTLKELQQIHGQAITRGLHPHLQPLSCQILNSYARFGRTVEARELFLEIPHPDLVSITSFMSLHLQTDHPRRAISLFSEIVASGRRPDGFSIVGALSASGRIADPAIGKSLHGLVYRHGLGHESVVGNAVIDMYCRNGTIRIARMVFNEMPARDAVTWSSMLHGYIKCQGLESACEFFDEMPQRDAVSWTVMITGHVQGKQPVRALELFHRMKSEGHDPTLVTIVGVLSACADIGALDLGRAIHGYINKTKNVGSDITVYNAIIDMYAKSGNVEMAYDIFKESIYKDVFTWTTMIAGFAVHGSGKQAMEVFLEMLNAGIEPNEVTFLAVLSACSHAGFIDEGKKWFESMSRAYNIRPQIEHYGCVVDLLGRAGLLSEAELLIEKMGMEPDCVIWRSLLNACLVHGNVRLAEIAGKEIMKREPDDDGVYVLLWNLYASSNRWEEALEMRNRMRNRKVIKKPGCSWIEIDGFVHEFLVEDKMHCHRREIFLVLEGMARQLKMDDTVFLFQEADQREFYLGLMISDGEFCAPSLEKREQRKQNDRVHGAELPKYVMVHTD